jgi:hypothetical protein
MGPRRLRLNPTIDPAGHSVKSAGLRSRRYPQPVASVQPVSAPPVQHTVKRILLRAPKGPFEVHSAEDTLDRNLIAENSGNLVFIHAAWKLLSAPGVEISPDRLVVQPDAADEINERFDAYVIPLANAFRLQYQAALVRTTELVRRLRIPVVVLGVGAQGTVDLGWDAIRPIEGAVKDFVSAVLDRSPTIGVRGEATREYLNGLGFRDVDVIGCPSMFMWGDTIPVERKAATLDKRSNVAITISPYRAVIGGIAMAAHARYPRLTYFAQDLPTLRLLFDGTPLPGGTPESLLPVHPGHPFFREHRTRFYVDPWPWIEDLRDYEFSFGTRIHGTIAALLAGTPAVVLAHDSRTLELARYFDIPHRLLRDVPPDLDPANLYAEADFTALRAGHADRFDTLVRYLAGNGLDHVFAHHGAAADFERRIRETDYPGSVQQWWPEGGATNVQLAARRLRRRARRAVVRLEGGRSRSRSGWWHR